MSGVAGKDFGRILKFTSEGKFLMQIGETLPAGQAFTNNSTTALGRQPADMFVDLKTNELFVADGDGGASRMIVFDSETGKYKRMWGAYGEKPGELPAPKHDPNGPASKVFSSAVHCVKEAKDGSLFVCDRNGDRIQVFKKDGTFVKEKIIAPQTMGTGSAFDVQFSPDHKYLYWVDGGNQKVRILQADSLEEVGSFGGVGQGLDNSAMRIPLPSIPRATFTSLKPVRESAFRSLCQKRAEVISPVSLSLRLWGSQTLRSLLPECFPC